MSHINDIREEAENRYRATQAAPYRIRPAMIAAFIEGTQWALAARDADVRVSVSAEQVKAALDKVWSGVYDSEKGYCLADSQIPTLLAALGITVTDGPG